MRFFLLAFVSFTLAACSATTNTLHLAHDMPADDALTKDYAVSPAALEKLKTRYENAPDSPKVIRKYAGGLYQAEDFETVIKILTPFVESDAAEAKDFYFYAKALHENKHDSLAKVWLAKALDGAPDMTAARLMLGDIYESEDAWKAAELLYLDVLDADDIDTLKAPEHIQLALAHILNLVSQKRVQDAGMHMVALKQLYPDNRLVERNKRIVLAMMQSHGHSAPKPLSRPERLL